MLHITNGDSAVELMREAKLEGAYLPWRDVLHEGPVPADLSLEALSQVRARFLRDQGWGEYNGEELFAQRDDSLKAFRDHDEVVLWFEHDLYDQLQLLQILDWFQRQDRGNTALTMICRAEYIGMMSPERVRELFPLREAVTGAQLELASRAWGDFRSEDPRDLEALIEENTAALPWVAPALKRMLEEYPSARNGLGRTERQALAAIDRGCAMEIVDKGETPLGALFQEATREEPLFMGDTTFAFRLEYLSRVDDPLLRLKDGQRLRAPRSASEGRGFWKECVGLTETGERVLAGEADHVALNGIDRWFGGVHLEGRNPKWRWDEKAERIVSAGG